MNRMMEKRDTHAMQIWPEWLNPPNMTELAAASKFASFKTMTGALPPSSMQQGFKYLPATSANFLPTNVLPVKLILRTAL